MICNFSVYSAWHKRQEYIVSFVMQSDTFAELDGHGFLHYKLSPVNLGFDLEEIVRETILVFLSPRYILEYRQKKFTALTPCQIPQISQNQPTCNTLVTVSAMDLILGSTNAEYALSYGCFIQSIGVK